MSRVALVAVFFWLSTNAWGLGDQPLIDPGQKKIDEEIKIKIIKCEEKLRKDDLAGKMECVNRTNYEYQKRGLLRGTKEYFEAHYKALSTQDLVKKMDLLMRQKEKARFRTETGSDPAGKRDGELTKETLQNEIIFIDLEIRDRKAHRKQ
jgi:hypothetical protein